MYLNVYMGRFAVITVVFHVTYHREDPCMFILEEEYRLTVSDWFYVSRQIAKQ